MADFTEVEVFLNDFFEKEYELALIQYAHKV